MVPEVLQIDRRLELPSKMNSENSGTRRQKSHIKSIRLRHRVNLDILALPPRAISLKGKRAIFAKNNNQVRQTGNLQQWGLRQRTRTQKGRNRQRRNSGTDDKFTTAQHLMGRHSSIMPKHYARGFNTIAR